LVENSLRLKLLLLHKFNSFIVSSKKLKIMGTQNQSRTLLLALLIIGAGVFLLLESIHVIPYDLSRIFISWQMLLIVIGIYNLTSSQHKTGGIILIFIGGLFLYDKFYDLQFHVWNVIWPTILIIVGVSILLNHSRGKKNYFDFGKNPVVDNGKTDEFNDDKTNFVDDADTIDEVSIFSGSEKQITSKNFRGGKITSIFGGSEINLSRAELSNGRNQIEVFYMFGGSTIIVPPDWDVRIDVIAVFGGFSDKRYHQKAEGTNFNKQIVIKGLVVFGGGEIKSY
jgi:predicted membrane protein